MADFCRKCSVNLFGHDHGDLKGLITEEKVRQGFLLPTICEGCGYIYVNHKGERSLFPPTFKTHNQKLSQAGLFK